MENWKKNFKHARALRLAILKQHMEIHGNNKHSIAAADYVERQYEFAMRSSTDFRSAAYSTRLIMREVNVGMITSEILKNCGMSPLDFEEFKKERRLAIQYLEEGEMLCAIEDAKEQAAEEAYIRKHFQGGE